MNGRSDASTSTDDDIKSRPLCLFYFTHPFGVLSSEPPTLVAAPAHLARTYVNMQPLPRASWPTDPAPRAAYDLGNTTVHRNPLHLVNPPIFNLSSTGSFPRDVWLSSSSSQYTRRLAPYNRTLPPLQLPAKDLSPQECSHDFWPTRCLNPEKFSLPPLELQCPHVMDRERSVSFEECEARSMRRGEGFAGKGKGVRRERKRPRRSRHVITSLIRRKLTRGQESSSPALRRALRTVRAAWTEPTALHHTCRKLKRIRTGTCSSTLTCEGDSCSTDKNDTRMYLADKMASRAQMSGLPPRAGASPGLLRRRYSMPETIMRKYRLEQQRSECSTSCVASAAAAVPACGPRCRDHMRRSALLRRLWGRAASPACCHSRSLHTSRSELLPSPRLSPAASGWATPKRQRLDPPHDDMLRAALGNSARDSDSTYRPSSSYVDTERTPFYQFNTSTQSVRSEASTVDMDSVTPAESSAPIVTDSYSESDQITSVMTAVETSPERAGEQNGQNDEYSNDKNLMVYESVEVRAPAYEVLEIVVSEIQESSVPAIKTSSPLHHPAVNFKLGHNIDIDEYVSQILVESLNSLTDQLESMNASIDRKISIVEKEIKVKLQNTGVNTIVHLSPTSNHQIIFGNEELCNRDERDACNNRQQMECVTIREETPSAEFNNNLVEEDQQVEEMTSMTHEVNRAVLQQIQKLFQEELQELSPEVTHLGISHVDVSNVDVYIDKMQGGDIQLEEQITVGRADSSEALSGVGTGNYYEMSTEPLVARYSACPYSASMEVNTSSDDALSVSSLVDSLDDPRSPRAPTRAPRRNPLVRSAIDVLDLLPEDNQLPREKSEAYFVRIDDEDLDCDKENINVADHMPEKIKQKLFRRHRKRELRMESARRSRVKQLRRELERQRREDLSRSKREVEKECMAIINALIDDVINKIAQDEYKCMRIKQRSNKSSSKSDDVVKRKRDAVRESNMRVKPSDDDSEYRRERQRIHGKLSLRRPDDRARRIYQKSEIHEGDKCIEILEILEYGNTSSSPETNSDESRAKKKSRIPVPLKCSPPKCVESHERVSAGHGRGVGEGRARSSSLRFRRVFDVIPEERALSGDSVDEAALLRRASAPSLALLPTHGHNQIESSTRTVATSPPHEHKVNQITMTSPLRRSAATSPLRTATSPSTPATTQQNTSHSSSYSSRLSSRGRACLTLPKHDPRPTHTSVRSVTTQYSPIDKRTHTEKVDPPIEGVDSTNKLSKRDEKRKQTKRKSKDTSEKVLKKTEKRRMRVVSVERSEEGGSGGRGEVQRKRSSSSESSSSLLCARWRGGRQRRDSTHTKRTQATPSDAAGAAPGAGSWSVSVAGSCGGAAPRDLHMRLRFPPPSGTRDTHRADSSVLSYGDNEQECTCACLDCVRPRERRARPLRDLPPAPAPRAPRSPPARIELCLKKEASDSSIVASKSRQKSSDTLPHLETYRASRSNNRTSLKMQRACSLHCWLPEGRAAPIRGSRGLSVLGCAIVPELKPRVRTMSERDVTRLYLRS